MASEEGAAADPAVVDEGGAPAKGDEAGGRRPKKVPKAPKPPVEPRVKWTAKEDVLLAEAWKTVSLDPIVGANQNMDNYWKRVKSAYNERQMIDPDYSMCVTPRGEKAMANHWANIQHACNKWHGVQEEVANRPKSGSNYEMEVSSFPPSFPF